MTLKKTRWQQRFQNFERAFLLLKSVFDEKKLEELSDLEKEGVIQRFECTVELAWKTMKDYLEYTGVVFELITPRHVIKQAFSARVIEDGQAWIEMLDHRNLMSHTYDKATFEKVVAAIKDRYLRVLNQVFLLLQKKDKET